VLPGPEHYAASPPFPLMGVPADLLRHPHRHLLLLPTTPVCQRTSPNLDNLLSRKPPAIFFCQQTSSQLKSFCQQTSLHQKNLFLVLGAFLVLWFT